MNSVEIITTSRREFINLCHMLSHAIDLRSDDKLVVDIIGGRNIKKSLAVDAFLLAMEHKKGVFHVPSSNKMMFEDMPSQADGDIAQGSISHNGRNVEIGFTRNLWDQMNFSDNAPYPSVLIIPKKNESSLSAIKWPDVAVHLSDISNGKDAFNHHWRIEICSDRLFSRRPVQQFLYRCSMIERRRAIKPFQAMTP